MAAVVHGISLRRITSRMPLKQLKNDWLGHQLPTGRVSTPLEEHGYHPEVDETALLDDDQANYYQSMIGILLWASELDRIDITQEVGTMARFGVLPQEGHYKAVLRIFSYLKST
jgi:hypothetical protein